MSKNNELSKKKKKIIMKGWKLCCRLIYCCPKKAEIGFEEQKI